MKTKTLRNGTQIMIMLLAFLILLTMQNLVAQVCMSPSTTMYGLTGTGEIRPVTISTGNVGAVMNPAGVAGANLANAMGYNQVNGRFYYFKRNILGGSQQFVCYDPVMNTTTLLANSPITTIVNLGACHTNGFGYYCIDALGILYYYRIATNTWVTITNNVRNQASVPLATIINPGGGMPDANDRIYGDMAFDGSGNLWIIISGPDDFGLYKLPSAVPTTAVGAGTGLVTIREILPPTTLSPESQSIGGAAFNTTGQLLFTTNAGHNKIYRIENNYSRTFVSNLNIDAVGTDLTSCSAPMFVLSAAAVDFDAKLANESALLNWSVSENKEIVGYTVEHSTDGKSWDPIGYFPASNRENSVQTYSYTHRNLVKGKHYYRLVTKELGERNTYSQERMLSLSNGASLSVWPNPAQDKLQLALPADKTEASLLTVYDQAGRTVMSLNLKAGTNAINIKSLAPGTYFLRVAFTSGEVINQRFIKNSI